MFMKYFISVNLFAYGSGSQSVGRCAILVNAAIFGNLKQKNNQYI